jgi:hypothetical protein
MWVRKNSTQTSPPFVEKYVGSTLSVKNIILCRPTKTFARALFTSFMQLTYNALRTASLELIAGNLPGHTPAAYLGASHAIL